MTARKERTVTRGAGAAGGGRRAARGARDEPWMLERGARVLPGDAGVRFSVWAPKVTTLAVRVRTGGAQGDVALERTERGVFAGTVPGARAGDDYVYLLNGREERPDPVSRFQPEGVHGPSRVVDPNRFSWSDTRWRGPAMADYIIYEMHVGTFTDAGTFDAAIADLARLAALGITAIELMPVAEFPGARNWGYDGVLLYAPHNAYGGPDGLRRLVDAAHGHGLAVVLDVVYNHLGPEGNVLDDFGPYFTDRYQTPWGRAVNYDGAESDEVRRFVIDNARYWVAEYHVDALRLDAVHGIYDFGARHILAELADHVHTDAHRLERRVQVIAESDLNDPRLIRDAEHGGYGLDAQWSDDFHHAVHAALTGEREGYYGDFGKVCDVATALEHRFVYDGRYSAYRQRRHGASAADVEGDRFVIAIQNHDQVGNRARGDRLSTLLSFEQCKLAAALLLLAPYVPLLFMGEEYGETHPFLYFVSHGDPALVEAVRAGRRREFAHFGWSEDVPDPQSPETFAASTLDRSVMARGEHASLVALYRDLLHLRRSEPALRPGATAPRVACAEEDRCLAYELESAAGGGRRLLALFNLSDAPRQLRVANAAQGSWTLRLSTTDAAYGGSGTAPRSVENGGAGERRIDVAAYSAAVYLLHE
ncbi:MAG TPA: malto-oligosyltrehalose trehalohydrolase [Gemmatimonadaceae bacterium]|nr:malto-oligosyltrehalose trehalohydrolase [Gemmatimonadaceae bacterium]